MATVGSSSRPSSPAVVAIIGAGVIGLSCALKIQQELVKVDGNHRPQVLLVSRHWPGIVPGLPSEGLIDYASMWAGAHVRPIPATSPQLQREAAWLKQTVAEFGRRLDEEPECGLSRVTGVEFIEDPDEGYQGQDANSFKSESGLSGYRKLDASEMPDGIALGFEYDTFCLHPHVYCQYLLRKFVLAGGLLQDRQLKSEWEAFTLRENVLLVVNASGTGFHDTNCFPTRGQTMVTNLCEVTKTVTQQNKNGSWSFLIPRFFNGGTIIGGTKETDDWRANASSSTRERLLTSGLALEPYARSSPAPLDRKATELTVLSDVVGRRPTRQGGMRLELQERDLKEADGGSRSCRLIHAYGAGGRGYEISWGVADEVLQLARPLLQSNMETAPLT